MCEVFQLFDKCSVSKNTHKVSTKKLREICRFSKAIEHRVNFLLSCASYYATIVTSQSGKARFLCHRKYFAIFIFPLHWQTEENLQRNMKK